MSQLYSTTLYAELSKRAEQDSIARTLRGRIDASLNQIESMLSETRRFFFYFTDHTISHSVRIVDSIGRLLSDYQIASLSNHEIYLTIGAALAHDIGLVITEDEARNILNDPENKLEIERIRKRFEFEKHADIAGGVDRHIVSELVRRHHGRRCSYMLNDDWDALDILTGSNQSIKKWIGRIAIGHCLDFADLLDDADFPTGVFVDSDEVNIRFICFLLRIGDLLDIGTPRAEPFMQRLSEPLSQLSLDHWNQYTDIERHAFGHEKAICISGTCPTQRAERTLREWVRWLKEEIEQATVALNTHPQRYRLAIGPLEYKVQPKKLKNGLPAYEFHDYRFNLDNDLVFRHLMGNRLYGREDTALRELMQNAVDATRVRLAVECKNDHPANCDDKCADDLESLYNEYYKNEHLSYPITVKLSVEIDPLSGERETWLAIEDNGVGMARDTLEQFFLQVGRSRWKTDPIIRSLHISTIGEFGIGFMSTFMLSDKTVIDTQSCLPNEAGIRATVYNWSGFLATEPLDRQKPGTTVRLRLRRDVATYLQEHLEERIEYWCPFLEFPIEISTLSKTTRLAPIDRDTTSSSKLPSLNNTTLINIPIRESGSLCQIEGRRRSLSEDPLPSLSQDGLCIPDVPPPLLDTPEQSLLRLSRIRVDLRKSDRERLDLSRNLTEGGASSLWSRIVPQVWRAIANHALHQRGARDLFSSFSQLAFEQSKGKRHFILGPKGHTDFSYNFEKFYHSLRIIDSHSNFLPMAASESTTPTMIMPGVPPAIYYTLPEVNDIDDDNFIYWSRVGGSSSTEPLSSISIQATRKIILDKYPYITKFINGGVRFTSSWEKGSVPIDSLSMFRVSDNWVAIRSPISGLWEWISFEDLEGLSMNLPKGISIENLLLYTLSDVFSKLTSWKSDLGTNNLSVRTIRSVQDVVYNEIERMQQDFERRRTRRLRRTDEAHPDDEENMTLEYIDSDTNTNGYGDVESDGWANDDETELHRSEVNRLKRHKEAGLVSPNGELVIDSMSDLLPLIDIKGLETLVPPWDREAWSKNKWKSIRKT
ncbi:MAG: hypothetical protein CMJ35_16000 [Phycisphaerae bacterium]|nr:hypothetical protein [Phycisphaerae bacterium]MBM93091.1 hypothetical protein [Phycisphaerae bacterium]|tara:strand:- start:697 stop:3843 length:3147 start_codon:yes stop_codon:yes gene_type:complete